MKEIGYGKDEVNYFKKSREFNVNKENENKRNNFKEPRTGWAWCRFLALPYKLSHVLTFYLIHI